MRNPRRITRSSWEFSVRRSKEGFNARARIDRCRISPVEWVIGYFANVGALNLNLWIHTLIELWAWTRPASELSNRKDRPWDEADRRPSRADRRKALQRAIQEEEFRRLNVPTSYREKIRPLLAEFIKLAA